MSSMLRTCLAYGRLMRVHACITAAVGVLVAALLLRAAPPPGALSLAALVVFMITGAGNSLNDWYDAHIDRVNAPWRPIPSGVVSRSRALQFACVLFGLGLLISLFLPWPCIVIAACNAWLLMLYARYSKRWGLLKNAMVAYLVGSVFLFTALALHTITFLVMVLAGCAFLATWSRELVKDIEDLTGDQTGQAQTLPIRIGAYRSRQVAFALLGASVLLALVPVLLGLLPHASALLILLGAALFVYAYVTPHAALSQRVIMAGCVVELGAFWVATRW